MQYKKTRIITRSITQREEITILILSVIYAYIY